MKISQYIEQKIPLCQNKRVLITGANSGIGFEAAKILASKGAELIFACRNMNKAQKAKDDILALYPNTSITILPYDQASFKSIDNFVSLLKEQFDYIDVLVLNAGIYHPAANLVTEDGFPLTIGTNYIGAYYFLKQVLPFLEQNENGKIVFVSSLTYKYNKIKSFECLSKKINPHKSYGQSKICLAKLFLSCLKKTKLRVYLMHPGVASTNIFSSKDTHFPKWFMALAHKVLPLFTHSPKKAALGIVYLVSHDDLDNGLVLGPRGLFEWSGYPKKRELPRHVYKNVDALIDATEQVIKEKKGN